MHKALYREYRPLSYDDVVGQDHIVKTLKHQQKENTLSHAYLFCGTRGTGKTTTAKILSRAVNCISDSDDKPCNECPMCKSILEASNLDVVEIDAASNNSVDDIRELRETVKYTPNESKYKIYIIDEVHMLSAGAYNALLKTLEEPPEYVIFILATTEPNKIPATILSRCQRFDFKRVSDEDLIGRMKYICSKENIEYDEDALKIIARNAKGSVRDSLSILDKCASFSSEKLSADLVLDLLGSTDPEQILAFAISIIESNVSESMKLIENYYSWGKDLKLLVEDLIDLFRSIMMVKISSNNDSLIEYSAEYSQKIDDLSKSLDTEELIRILNNLSELIDKLKYSSNQRMTVEIYIMKLSSPAMDSSDESLKKRLENIEKLIEDGKIQIVGQSQSNIDRDNIEKSPEISTIEEIEVEGKSETTSVYKDIVDDDDINEIKANWDKLLEQMKLDKKMPLRAFLAEKYDIKYKNKILYVILSDDFSFAINRLKEQDSIEYIQSTMRKIFGLNLELRFILKEDLSSMDFGIDKKEEDADELSESEKLLKEVLGDSKIIIE